MDKAINCVIISFYLPGDAWGVAGDERSTEGMEVEAAERQVAVAARAASRKQVRSWRRGTSVNTGSVGGDDPHSRRSEEDERR